MSEPLVVIGNGMAAARFAEEMSRRALGRYAIAIVGEEPRLAYNRVLLSSLLAREISRESIELRSSRWWRDHGITLNYGCRAVTVDPVGRRVTLADGTGLAFSKLMLATGSRPIGLDVPGMELPGVLTFRNIEDVDAMIGTVSRATRIVVIGGGLLGLEAAHGLAKAGACVTLLHLMDRLMERQLDRKAAAMLRRAIEDRGIAVRLEAATARIIGNGRVEAVELADGSHIDADMVVLAIGVRPNVELARACGLDVRRGIVVDDALETSISGIHAIGECAEHRGQCYGLVQPAHEQACVLSRRLAGETAAYGGSVLSTNLKVSGVDVFSAGEFQDGSGTEQIVYCDPGEGVYKKLVIAQDRLVGAVLYGDTADGLWYLDLIRTGVSIEPFRDELAFGRAMAMRRAA